jgi:ribosomal protein S12 methylthiotransferase
VVTLGCDKNTVDSERVLGRLAGAGLSAGNGADGADIVVINTCGFIDSAKEEAIDAILTAVRLKGEGHARAVVAMGCLVQRYKTELEAEIPEVDLFLGLTEVDRLIPELEARGVIAEVDAAIPTMERPLRVLSTSTRHTSFLKISEGCDHGCAFCAIPQMRGKHRSTPIERLVREARELEAAGVVELNIISQDTTWYGRDWRGGGAAAHGAGANGVGANGAGAGELFVGRPYAGMAGLDAAAALTSSSPVQVPVPVSGAITGAVQGVVPAGDWRRGALPELLRALLAETGVPWFRLFYMYPSGITRELVELMAGEPRLLPYLDMPIQHGSDEVLRRMRRPERQATIRERVGWLRAALPDLVLRTTVIVGFPGETDEEFEAMLDLLEEIRFDHLGAFPYSREEGTPAALMGDQVDGGVKRERLERVLDLQRSITLEKNEALVGRRARLLVDRVDGDGEAVGRTAGQAVDVDGVTRIRGASALRPGVFADVDITGANEDDLFAEHVVISEVSGE